MNKYFSHDSNARNDAKILNVRMKHGAEGYGVYFMLLERLDDEQDYMSVKDYNMIAFDLRVDANLIKSVVEDFGLFAFTEDGECFYSEEFNRRKNMKDEVSKVRSEAGRRGMAKRWGEKSENNKNNKSDNKAITKSSEPITNVTFSDNNKIKENKENKKESVYKEKADAASFSSSPPTHTQVSDFAKEEGLTMDVDAFIDYNTARGWMIGSNPMKDWRAAARKWARIDRDKPKKLPREPVHIPTVEELCKEREEKAAANRQRIMGYYEQAKRGVPRFVALVKDMEVNGVLAEYGLEPLRC